jgi:hypothetical protein
MARLRIDNRPNVSAGQDHTTTHRNLALNGAQCGSHICESSNGGNRPLNRLALELARSKVSVIDNDRGTAALEVNVGKVCELHHLLNLRRTQLVSSGQSIELRASIERCARDGAVEQSSVKEAVAELCRNSCADATLPA